MFFVFFFSYAPNVCSCFFFFFQAEDGIRDFHVTGVQTCALPIFIGAGEKLAEVLLAPVLIRWFDLAGGGIENWFAYALALVFLLVRPQGLFGEKIIERI